jgi:hypothetical protein
VGREDSLAIAAVAIGSSRPTSDIEHMQMTAMKRTFLEGDRLKMLWQNQ